MGDLGYILWQTLHEVIWQTYTWIRAEFKQNCHWNKNFVKTKLFYSLFSWKEVLKIKIDENRAITVSNNDHVYYFVLNVLKQLSWRILFTPLLKIIEL